ncbi:MAG: hypothetical protein AAB612_02965, partial [Patescibacteria group bacterium]
MKLKIEPEIFDQYPEVILGVVVLHGMNNTGNDVEITSLLRDAEKTTLGSLGDTLIVEHPFIVPWREAYR